MSEHPNAARIRDAMEAFNEGDVQRQQQFFSEDVVWHVAGDHPLAGSYQGQQSLGEYFAAVREATAASLTLEPLVLAANDRFGGAILRATAQRDGRRMNARLAQAYRFDREGRCVEYWAMADDQEALNRFWS